MEEISHWSIAKFIDMNEYISQLNEKLSSIDSVRIKRAGLKDEFLFQGITAFSVSLVKRETADLDCLVLGRLRSLGVQNGANLV